MSSVYRQRRHEKATRTQVNNSRRHHYYCCHHQQEAKLVQRFFWTVPCFQVTHADEALGMEEIRSRPCPAWQGTAATGLAQTSRTINHSKLQETVNSIHARTGRAPSKHYILKDTNSKEKPKHWQNVLINKSEHRINLLCLAQTS